MYALKTRAPSPIRLCCQSLQSGLVPSTTLAQREVGERRRCLLNDGSPCAVRSCSVVLNAGFPGTLDVHC